MNDDSTKPAAAKVGDKNIAPNTTAAEDLMTVGQRRINLIWESTQAFVAVSVTVATLYVSARLALTGGTDAPFILLSNTFFLVIGTYISRSNHNKIGGVKTGDLGR